MKKTKLYYINNNDQKKLKLYICLVRLLIIIRFNNNKNSLSQFISRN